jgi:hypothetical protein
VSITALIVEVHPHIAAWRGKLFAERDFTMPVPQPEGLSKLHLTVLEIEGILFNILLFCKFALKEILDIIHSFHLH